MFLFMSSDRLLHIQQLDPSLIQTQPVAVCQVMSFFRARSIFQPTDMHNFPNCFMSFRVTCRMYTSLQVIYLLSLHLFSLMHHLWSFSQLQQSLVPMWFPYVVIAADVIPSHLAFYFEDLGLLWTFSRTCSGPMCMVHIASAATSGQCINAA